MGPMDNSGDYVNHAGEAREALRLFDHTASARLVAYYYKIIDKCDEGVLRLRCNACEHLWEETDYDPYALTYAPCPKCGNPETCEQMGSF